MGKSFLLRHPGLFITQRPLLSLTLLIASLLLIAFRGGRLLDDLFWEQLVQLLFPIIGVGASLGVMAVGLNFIPKHNYGRVIIASGLVLLGLGWFFLFATPEGGAELIRDLGALAGIAGFCLFLFCQKQLGLRYQILLATLPIFAAVSVLIMGGVLLRQGFGELLLVEQWSVLGFCLALYSGGIAVSTMSFRQKEMSNRLFAGAVLNRILRDYLFWILIASIGFYFDDSSVASSNSILGPILSIGLLSIAIFPVLIFLAAIWSIGLPSQAIGEELRNHQKENLKTIKSLLSSMPEPALRAVALGAIVLALAAFFELSESATASGDGVLAGSAFLAGVFCVVAFVYSSLRMALVVAVVYGCASLIVESAGIFNSAAGEFSGLPYLLSKMLVLFSVVNITRVWSELLHDRSVVRSQISLALAKTAMPTLGGFAFAITGLFLSMFVMPQVSEMAGLVILYSAALMTVSASILVPSMLWLRRFRPF